MAIIKCKMCGGTIEFEPGATVGTCEYCGTKQTLPKTNDDVLANLFNRANNLRLKCEFDKAEQIYERIVQQDDSEAEAHWGIVLCKYGIEYVKDPKTLQQIPTCHRTLYEAVTSDPDYLAAVDYSDVSQQALYESEARAIDHIQRDILAIVKNEKPFDVFICYKETDENGKRTVDSTIANDIYYQLTEDGYKVFYAAITLEDKLGQEYEPYIFAALNSAKVMLVIGTKPEYFNAVWVKNEWSRYLKLMKTDRSKLLIPCYRDMDAYDLPEEFAHLQAQDMSRIGFMHDLIRGINKVVNTDGKNQTVQERIIVNDSGNIANVTALLRRAELFLEDGSFSEASEYYDKVLDMEPENADAYLGKVLARFHIKNKTGIRTHIRQIQSDYLVTEGPEEISESSDYRKFLRFADNEFKNEIQEMLNVAREHGNADIYNRAISCLENGDTIEDMDNAIRLLEYVPDYLESELAKKEALEKKENIQKEMVRQNTLETRLNWINTNLPEVKDWVSSADKPVNKKPFIIFGFMAILGLFSIIGTLIAGTTFFWAVFGAVLLIIGVIRIIAEWRRVQTLNEEIRKAKESIQFMEKEKKEIMNQLTGLDKNKRSKRI